MDICVFYNYKVKHICNYTYINEEGDFSNGKVEEEFEKSGGELLDLISKSIKENNVIDTVFGEKEIDIEEFNAMTGEYSTHKLIIEVVKGNKGEYSI